jgi:hypothetical protein
METVTLRHDNHRMLYVLIHRWAASSSASACAGPPGTNAGNRRRARESVSSSLLHKLSRPGFITGAAFSQLSSSGRDGATVVAADLSPQLRYGTSDARIPQNNNARRAPILSVFLFAPREPRVHWLITGRLVFTDCGPGSAQTQQAQQPQCRQIVRYPDCAHGLHAPARYASPHETTKK